MFIVSVTYYQFIVTVKFLPPRSLVYPCLHSAHQVFIYVHCNSSILDSTQPVSPEEWPVVHFKFTSLQDVQLYWFKLQCVCFNTPIGESCQFTFNTPIGGSCQFTFNTPIGGSCELTFNTPIGGSCELTFNSPIGGS